VSVEQTVFHPTLFQEYRIMLTSLVRRALALALMATLALASTADANPSGGAVSGVNRVPARGLSIHRIVYNGGEIADFEIVGDGSTTLNLIVKDANGVELGRTTGPGDRVHLRWTPSRTGAYYIIVVNEGGVYNQYRWRGY
jgi:hypothetical protein